MNTPDASIHNERATLLQELFAVAEEIGLHRQLVEEALKRPIAVRMPGVVDQAHLFQIESLTRSLRGLVTSVKPKLHLQTATELVTNIWVEDL